MPHPCNVPFIRIATAENARDRATALSQAARIFTAAPAISRLKLAGRFTTSRSSAKAFQVPKLAEKHGIYCDMRLDSSAQPAAPAGMFVRADTGLAEKAMNEGILLAPGRLFSPSQLPSRHVRLNIAALSDPEVRAFLECRIFD